MNKQGLKTVKDISKIVGMEPRKIKYLREVYLKVRKNKTINNFPGTLINNDSDHSVYYYSEEDIKRLKQLAIFKELGYSDKSIALLLDDVNLDWIQLLENQIIELREKKKSLEETLISTEFIVAIARDRNNNDDSSILLDSPENIIDDFKDSLNSYKLLEHHYLAAKENVQNHQEEMEQAVMEMYLLLKNETIQADNPNLQMVLKRLIELVAPNNTFSSVLFLYRIICCDFGGFSFLFDMITKELGGRKRIDDAMEICCHSTEKNIEKEKIEHSREEQISHLERMINENEEKIMRRNADIKKKQEGIQRLEAENQNYLFSLRLLKNEEKN